MCHITSVILQQDLLNNYDYTYHNVGAELPVPSTPFTLYGHVGFTDSDTDGSLSGYGFTDYKVGVSTSILDWIGELNLRQLLVMRLMEKTKMIP